MSKFINNIKKYYKYAIYSAKAELKSEVADSYLNWLWWIVEPFCFMLIYTFVFGVVFKNNTPYFASFVFIGLTAWDFFNRMINGSVKLIINNRDLVTKVYIPKEKFRCTPCNRRFTLCNGHFTQRNGTYN